MPLLARLLAVAVFITLPLAAHAGDADAIDASPIVADDLTEAQKKQIANELLKAWSKLLSPSTWIQSASEECQRIRPQDADRIAAAHAAYESRNETNLAEGREIVHAALTALSDNTASEIDAWLETFAADGLEVARANLLGELARYGDENSVPVQNYCRNSVDMMKDQRFAVSRDSLAFDVIQRYRHLKP